MKPPVRRRTAPQRFVVLDSAPARVAPIRLAWLCKEKMELLRGLKAQVGQKVPDPPVQGRSKSEVSSYIAWLRSRAAREAVQTVYEKWVQDRKAEEAETPVPIELWTDLVYRMSKPTEEALTAAFSQMLTIASTEPLTLRHSIPCKEPRKRASRSNSPAMNSSQQEKPSGEGPAPSGVEPVAVEEAADGRWKKLDFEKIYKYLSKASMGETLPKLSECESAVVLNLLYCIPGQLQTLNAQALCDALRDTYTDMNKPTKSENSEQESAALGSQAADWKELGFCPLNPLMLPLEVLKPK
ncbi:snRNA-activating protein complex subunit 2 [Rana temporaria]|uniref:snRNA-activating protein complex subunit 2 n=1 Tax=Rana temporaria TaxID=8407 RepID=UPI001AAD6EF7|nr:snRNA-activating protein complex subunit 2 [Rana temporaria]